jgi:hypothetical protein
MLVEDGQVAVGLEGVVTCAKCVGVADGGGAVGERGDVVELAAIGGWWHQADDRLVGHLDP